MPHRHKDLFLRPVDQILSAAAMRAAEQTLIEAGVSVDALMQRAGSGAAEYVWRVAGPSRRVTVLTGPGNNGGDGWVIAQRLRQRGAQVTVVPAADPRSEAAVNARAAYGGAVTGGDVEGDVLVDCLYGTGLTRGLGEGDMALLAGLAGRHAYRIAIDLPSGIATDTGAPLNEGLPDYHMTIALGAWKPAHMLMPSAARMGALRLVGIGCAPQAGAGAVVRQPVLHAPAADAHKYRRGLVAVAAGAMPGAAVLSAVAAQGAGAGYVKLLADGAVAAPADVVVAAGDMTDPRIGALLVGPGLGRDAVAQALWRAAMASGRPVVADADALWLMGQGAWPDAPPAILTPHAGEFDHLFGPGDGADKIARTRAAAQASGAVVVHKGPDTVIAAPDGRWAAAPLGPSWLSVAGSGDVLAGCIAARLAAGEAAFAAACQGVWLQAQAARLCAKPFAALALAHGVASAYGACVPNGSQD
ncbi:MAG TPA: NAD(P)H-hydrate dehydratase [Novosphingobium sp.]|nr:NAD(P)H-hydrate dehydratase [Novosphingobium sp.]